MIKNGPGKRKSDGGGLDLPASYFCVDGGSSAIVMVTTQVAPREGQMIVPRGVVKQAYTIGQKRRMVLINRPHRAPDRPAGK